MINFQVLTGSAGLAFCLGFLIYLGSLGLASFSLV